MPVESGPTHAVSAGERQWWNVIYGLANHGLASEIMFKCFVVLAVVSLTREGSLLSVMGSDLPSPSHLL